MKTIILLFTIMNFLACTPNGKNSSPNLENKAPSQIEPLAKLKKSCELAGAKFNISHLDCQCAGNDEIYLGGSEKKCISKSKVSSFCDEFNDKILCSFRYEKFRAHIEFFADDPIVEQFKKLNFSSMHIPLVEPEKRNFEAPLYKVNSPLTNITKDQLSNSLGSMLAKQGLKKDPSKELYTPVTFHIGEGELFSKHSDEKIQVNINAWFDTFMDGLYQLGMTFEFTGLQNNLNYGIPKEKKYKGEPIVYGKNCNVECVVEREVDTDSFSSRYIPNLYSNNGYGWSLEKDYPSIKNFREIHIVVKEYNLIRSGQLISRELKGSFQKESAYFLYTNRHAIGGMYFSKDGKFSVPILDENGKAIQIENISIEN